MSTTHFLSGTGLVKPVFKNHGTRYAEKMLPPEIRKYADGRTEPCCRFTEANGQENKLPCTPEVHRLCLGRRRPKAAHTGLDHQIHHRFVLRINPTTKQVDVIHAYQLVTSMHGLKRGDVPAHGKMVISVDDLGSIMVEDVPGDVTRAQVLRVIELVDAVGMLEASQDLGDGCVVSAVQGRTVFIDVDNISVPAVGEITEEAIFGVG